jgi:hypothetical protein
MKLWKYRNSLTLHKKITLGLLGFLGQQLLLWIFPLLQQEQLPDLLVGKKFIHNSKNILIMDFKFNA